MRRMEVLFLSEGKLTVCRIVEWEEMVEDLLVKGEWLMAMALLVSMREDGS